MLIEFSVANYRSILTKQTLSLVASSGGENEKKNVFSYANFKERFLRSAVIYGANAAGKSNLLKAILTLQRLILTTASSQEGLPLVGITPFLLDKESASQPSEFSIIFVADDGIMYEYYISATAKAVDKEWLVAYPNGRPQRWFERQLNKETKKYEWWFGTKFKGDKSEKKVWSEFTRANALFFSTAIQLNNEQLKPAFNWIANKLIVITSGVNINPWLSINLIKENQENKILDYLKAADIDIDGIAIREEDFPSVNQPSPLGPLSAYNNHFESTEGDEDQKPRLKKIQILTSHQSKNDQIVNFTLDDESEGTKQIFELTGGWIRSLEWGATLFVDELDRSLHTHITKFLVELFHSSKNEKNAQLIFTTHNTNLLDTDLLRRDQIWFVEKNAEKSSEFYSLLEYKPRKGEAIERGYLIGRYGAIPFVSEL
jgi:uncharacterized protein